MVVGVDDENMQESFCFVWHDLKCSFSFFMTHKYSSNLNSLNLEQFSQLVGYTALRKNSKFLNRDKSLKGVNLKGFIFEVNFEGLG